LDEKAERQQAFDQRWTIRWDATNAVASQAYIDEVEKRAEALEISERHDQVESSLSDISRCVWGAVKAAGLAIAKEHACAPPPQHQSTQAGR
jgi:hypothetical protein